MNSHDILGSLIQQAMNALPLVSRQGVLVLGFNGESIDVYRHDYPDGTLSQFLLDTQAKGTAISASEDIFPLITRGQLTSWYASAVAYAQSGGIIGDDQNPGKKHLAVAGVARMDLVQEDGSMLLRHLVVARVIHVENGAIASEDRLVLLDINGAVLHVIARHDDHDFEGSEQCNGVLLVDRVRFAILLQSAFVNNQEILSHL